MISRKIKFVNNKKFEKFLKKQEDFRIFCVLYSKKVNFLRLKGENRMKGKKRCKILKEIRRQIAQNNDIEFITSECKHQGDCLGTCPKCEAEVRYLERELEKRAKLGKAVAVAGLSVALMTSTVGCDDWFDGIGPTGGKPLAPEEEELGGKDVPVPDDEPYSPEDDIAGGVG